MGLEGSEDPTSVLTRRRLLEKGAVLFGAAAAGSVGLATGGPAAALATPTRVRRRLANLRVAYTATAFPSIVNNRAGLFYYGKKFGLHVPASNLQTFNDSATATQALFSGQADIVSGSFLSDLLVMQQGNPLRAIVSVSNGNDLLLVGSGNINTMDKITSSEAVVAIDSAGGLINLIYNAFFVAHGINQNVESLPQTKVYGDSPPRTASFMTGQTNVAIIHSTDLAAVKQAVGPANLHILATLWKDVHGMIFEVMAASTKWLAKNPQTAANAVKAVLTGNRELARDYKLYRRAIDQFIPGSGLTDANLKPVWHLARNYQFWPYNGDLENASINFTQKVGNQSGVFKGTLTPAQVANRKPLNAAIKAVGKVRVKDIVG
jgi:ABC-type nitrate/sulfonate/bicarbonate transport system substrate-binding protein